MGFTHISSTILRWKHVMASPFLCCFGLSGGSGGGGSARPLRTRCNSEDGLHDLDLAAARTITCNTQVQPDLRAALPSSPSLGRDEVGLPDAFVVLKQNQVFLINTVVAGVNMVNSSAGSNHTPSTLEVSPPSSPQSNDNVSISPTSTSTSQQSYTGTTYSSAHDDDDHLERNNGEHRLRLLGVLPNNPAKPEYATIEARLGSFMGCNWPHDEKSGCPQPEQLAEAGLYYMGTRDFVKCFFCDGRLRRWAPHDDAWVEHARWYPDCAFVHNVKGRHFIEAMLAQEERHASCSASTAASTSSSSSGDEISNSITTTSQRCESAEAARSENSAGEIFSADRVTPAPEEVAVSNSNTDQNRKSQQPSASSAAPACKICLDRDVCIAFLPCGHLSACAQCAPALQQCPICRTQILSTVRTYLV